MTWMFCENCLVGYKVIKPEDKERCPYCGSDKVREAGKGELVFVELAWKNPKMVYQFITTRENAEKMLKDVSEEDVAWKKILPVPADAAKTATSYKLALMNAISSRDPRQWRLVEDIKRIYEE